MGTPTAAAAGLSSGGHAAAETGADGMGSSSGAAPTASTAGMAHSANDAEDAADDAGASSDHGAAARSASGGTSAAATPAATMSAASGSNATGSEDTATEAATAAAAGASNDASDDGRVAAAEAERAHSEEESRVAAASMQPTAPGPVDPAPTPAAAAPVVAAEGGTKPEALSAAREGGADDLKRIRGIGPKLEILCNDLGFYHFDQIAGWSADEVAWVDSNLKGFKGRVTRDNWVEQAKLLASGGETEFSKRVDGGDVY